MKPWNCLHINSPLGGITLAASELGLCGVWFDEQRHGPSQLQIQRWTPAPQDPLLLQTAEQLHAYLAGQRQSFDLPLDLRQGTTFQQSVWHALLQVGFGQSQTYGDLARQLNKPQAVRAVGAAVGRNPVVSSCLATAFWVRVASSPAMRAGCGANKPCCSSKATPAG